MHCRRIVEVVLICLVALPWSCTTMAAAPDRLYFEAESCYQRLRNDPERQKYRSYWLQCIRRFENVQKQDPDGPWAAAGLFMAGSLYRQLYDHSYKPADLDAAAFVFRKIVENYPESAYRQRAQAALREIGEKREHAAEKARRRYFSAEACYRDLQKHPGRQKYRSYWMKCISRFDSVHDLDPDGPWAAAGLFMEARLYRELHAHSYNPRDLETARDIFSRIIRQYPSSAYREKARRELAALGGQIGNPPRELAGNNMTSGEINPRSTAGTGSGAAGDSTVVTGIRYWSNPEYTRVVIDASRETSFQNNLLKKDPSINQPHQRLYVDLQNSRLANDIQKQIHINDSLLKDVRAGQHDPDTVRVVVDIKSFENYNIFSLRNPFRIVIDIRGEAVAREGGAGFGGVEGDSVSIARQLALGVQRIAIDAGHGGEDYGAPGYIRGVHEKDVVLEIARKLARMVRKELDCEVILTRNKDVYLTLEERTAIANTKKADLFISIHANASRNQNAYGIETYFLNLTTDKESIAVAARENATSEKNISELQTILNDLMRNAKVNESSRLATYVHNSLFRHLDGRYSRVRDKGVKQAPFYVLLGAQMPSILIETSFISNKRECMRLTDDAYQRHLCEGIIKGVKRYIRETRPTAYLGPSQNR